MLLWLGLLSPANAAEELVPEHNLLCCSRDLCSGVGVFSKAYMWAVAWLPIPMFEKQHLELGAVQGSQATA